MNDVTKTKRTRRVTDRMNKMLTLRTKFLLSAYYSHLEQSKPVGEGVTEKDVLDYQTYMKFIEQCKTLKRIKHMFTYDAKKKNYTITIIFADTMNITETISAYRLKKFAAEQEGK